MKSKRLLINLLIVGMTLGTTWAVRGQFGHEHGAAWAGAIGAISIILIANRGDWYSKLFKATLAAAIGWGLGGIMSYGVVVGYGRGSDFINVWYGFLMLFIIGGLYGFLGGGLFGLTLTDSTKNKVNWPQLLSGMTAGGALTYYFLIMQWEWLMTPPRAEDWALCLGMALFMTWFLIQNKFSAALRVAVFAGLGGGFGFAFGNFLQTMGRLTDIQFNFWNVMEYTLGFCGGIGMAYGTFTSTWAATENAQKKSSNFIPILLTVLFIPFVVWQQAFRTERITEIYAKLIDGDGATVALTIQLVALALIIFQAAYVCYRYYFSRNEIELQYSQGDAKAFFLSHFGIYVVFSLLITGAIISIYRIEQYLYIINYGIIFFILPKLQPVFEPREINAGGWGRNFLIVILIIAVLAIIAANSHGELKGAHSRFEF